MERQVTKSRRYSLLKSNAGFTFIDAILTMLIVGIGLSGLMSYFVSVNRQTMNGDMTITASVLAQERLDQLVADKMYQGYNFIINGNYPSPENLADPFAGYTRSTTVTEVDPADMSTAMPGSGLKKVDIAVSWGANLNERVQLTTLVTSY